MKDNQFMLVLFKEKEEVNVKIVLLNVSPRRGGNTEIMINTFMENVFKKMIWNKYGHI